MNAKMRKPFQKTAICSYYVLSLNSKKKLKMNLFILHISDIFGT